MAGPRKHGLNGVGVESTCSDIGAKLSGCLVCRALGPVRSRLAHRLVGVCGAEEPGRAVRACPRSRSAPIPTGPRVSLLAIVLPGAERGEELVSGLGIK